MRPNLMKRKLAEGKPVFGVNVQEFSTQTIEIIGLLGFDYLTIDCLHSPLSVESVAHMVLSAELRGISTIVRAPQNVPEVILKYLDVGVMGISVADMDNAEIAERLVKAVKYPPEGERGLSSTHAADYGMTEPLSEYVKSANRETMAIGIVESKEGLENIEEILSVSGLDVVIIGTTDLSKSLGVPGQISHPSVLQAVDDILAAGKKLGKTIGITRNKVESPAKFIDQGFGMIGIHAKALLVDSARKYLKEARDHKKSGG